MNEVRKLLSIIILMFGSVVLIQGQTPNKKLFKKGETTSYLKIADYKVIIKKSLTKQDSLNFKINGNDTLVMVKGDLHELIKSSGLMKGQIPENKMITQQQVRSFVNINTYKKVYKKPITKQDSLNFRFKGNDTLVLVNEDVRDKFQFIPYEVKDSAFLEIYKDVVYRKYQTKKNDKNKDIMTLWTKPIKIYFSESVDEQYKNVITDLSVDISREVDSLNISIVKNLEESNYVIYQIDNDQSYKYSKNIKKNSYITYYSYWEKRKIYDTKLEINITKFKNKEINKKYLVKIFIQSLGQFHFTSKLPCENVLSNCNGRKIAFGKLDLELLKYHYSYGICKRTSLETFEKNHSNAQKYLKETNQLLDFMHVD